MKLDPDPAIDGVASISFEDLKGRYDGLASTPEEWRRIFAEATQSIQDFTQRYNAIEVIAKTATQALAGASAKNKAMSEGNYSVVNNPLTEVTDVELVQALALRHPLRNTQVPSAPSKLARFFPLPEKSIAAFLRMQPSLTEGMTDRQAVIHKVRMQTIYYRNSFQKDDCESVVKDILRRVDKKVSAKKPSTNYAKIFENLFAISHRAMNQLDQFRERIARAYEAKTPADVYPEIEFFCSISSTAKRAWALCKNKCNTLDELRWGAFQLSELCNSWAYTLNKTQLLETFGNETLLALERMSLRFGDLAQNNPEHFYLNNPIWRRPLIDIGDSFFFPIPTLIYGFPFQIFEHLIANDRPTQKAYFKARDEFLEEGVERLIKTAMPSARVYRNVEWRKDSEPVLFENDVVALIGNTIFLFEAKAGRLDQVARRGAEQSLIGNFKELFVEPALQAARLEEYINSKKRDARLWVKGTQQPVDLDLATPKVVHRFSICIENYAALSSAKHNVRVMGALAEDDPWSPVLSVGELMMLWRHLDTEISFFHYLTRRATLESVVEFEGDEQDLLSLYLTNGFRIDAEKMKGRRLQFFDFDRVVRVEKTPSEDRARFQIIGVPLSWYWTEVVKEIYQNTSMRHRFDIIQVILNLPVESLSGIEDVGRRWKTATSGRKEGDILFAKVEIGLRTFVVAYYLTKQIFTEDSWRERSRAVVREVSAGLFGGSDCVSFLRWKKSKHKTFDGVSFHRMMAVDVATPAS